VRNLSIKLSRIYVYYTNITLHNVIYSVRYYPLFHVTAVGLGTYYPQIRGPACIDKSIWYCYRICHMSVLFNFTC